ncbi:YjbQ family protein [bacterium]|nr:YjbQ family protein [bacterium]
MTVFHQSFRVQNDRNKPKFHHITPRVKELVAQSQVRNGIAVVYSPHTTCSVMIQEEAHDQTLDGTKFILQDLLDIFDKLIPPCRHEGQYLHPGPAHLEHATTNLGEEAVWSLNTDGHLRSCLLGRSESIPIVDGRPELGQFGEIYFVDFDTVRQRERRVIVQIIGE